MVEMLLGGKALQHWQQFKSQAMGLPILGVLDECEESSKQEEENDKAEKKKEQGQSSTRVMSPAGLTQDTYKLSMRKFMCYYFVSHQYEARTQKQSLRNYLCKPKELGIQHVVACQ
eukprot:2606290-Ditylum_brightwellii.AAC.1